MRLMAEEQRDGTLETLLTQPIKAWVVLIAKFLAGLLFVAVAILATVGIPVALGTAGDMDQGAVVSQYVGSLFLAASFVAIGLFTSSVSQNQIVAFILGFFFILVLMSAGLDQVAVTLPVGLASVLQTLSPVTHFSTIARGVIDLRDVLYFVALISTFLSAAYLMLRRKSLSHVSPQYRNLQVGVAAFIVLSLLVGWYGNSIGGRLDLTEDKIFTLSDGTNRLLSQLDDILTIKLFESKNPPPQIRLVARDVNDFLRDFAGSRDNVKFIRKFPDDDEDVAREAHLAGVPPVQFNVFGQTEISTKLGYLGITATYADRREVVQFVPSVDGFEYGLASLINGMLRQDHKTVGFLTGHGEKSVRQDLSAFAGQLAGQYDIVEIENDPEAGLGLSEIDVLVIAGPTEEVPDSERDEIIQYLTGGGKAMILLDPVLIDQGRLIAVPNRNSFVDLVEPFGVILEDNVVFDPQYNESLSFNVGFGNVVLDYPYWAHVPTVDRKVTGEVQGAVMPWASSLGIADAEVGDVEVIHLLRTHATAAVDYAYGDVTPNSAGLDLKDKQQFESDLAVAVTGTARNGGGSQFRIVVAGDSDWVSDLVANRSGENLALGLNLIDWLAQEDALAEIRSKVVASRQLEFTSSTHQNVVQYTNIIGIPFLFVLIGLGLSLKRRRETMKVYKRER
jgi:ABC-2 type transport system permease protein